MRWASPSTMAVLPTPGSPISTGLFLVRRDSTWMTRRISSSRPMTGSSLPLAAQLRQVAAVLLQRLVRLLRVLRRDALAAADLLAGRDSSRSRVTPNSLSSLAGRAARRRSAASSRCSTETYSSLSFLASSSASASSLLNRPRDVHVLGRTGRAGDARQLLQFALELDRQRVDRHAGLLQDGRGQALLLVEQRQQDVFDVDLLVVQPGRELLRPRRALAGLLGELVQVHRVFLPPASGTGGGRCRLEGPIAPADSPLTACFGPRVPTSHTHLWHSAYRGFSEDLDAAGGQNAKACRRAVALWEVLDRPPSLRSRSERVEFLFQITPSAFLADLVREGVMKDPWSVEEGL